MRAYKKEDIVLLPVDEVKPYPNNPRRNDNAVKAVSDSIERFGFRGAILVDENREIINGHTRWKAAKKLGMDKVPCIICDDLTEQEKKAFRIVDNRTNEFAEWDEEKLEAEWRELTEVDLGLWGFEFPEDDGEQSQIKEDEISEDIPKRAKKGDLWQLGDHRLICGDSTDPAVIDRLMDGARADMVLSDPPYGMNLDTDFSTLKGSMKSLGRKNHTEGNKYEKVIGDNEDFKPELITTFFENFNYVKEIFLFGADYFAELLPDKNKGSWLVWDKRKECQADAIGSEFELIWSRNKHKRRMLRHDWFGFLSSENGADARNRVHPTQKPITLFVDIIEQWGKYANVIVDLYGGSGSTLIACEQLNRKCYMVELDPHYCDVIIQRWEDLTGRQAVKIE